MLPSHMHRHAYSNTLTTVKRQLTVMPGECLGSSDRGQHMQTPRLRLLNVISRRYAFIPWQLFDTSMRVKQCSGVSVVQ